MIKAEILVEGAIEKLRSAEGGWVFGKNVTKALRGGGWVSMKRSLNKQL